MITIGGLPCQSITLTLPWSGCWEASVQWEGKGLSGAMTIDWRGWKLTGSFDPARTGVFAGNPEGVIVGGYAWTIARDWRPMTDDRGLTSRSIAIAVAEQLGQTIDVSLDRTIGKHFIPRHESGGQILTRLYGKDWYVDTSGVAKVRRREIQAAGNTVRVLEGANQDRRYPIYADRPDQVPVGCVLPLDARLKTKRRVTQVYAHAAGDKERVVCYTEAA